MRTLAARDLLQVWEWGEGQHPVDRALALLAVACPEMTRDELAALSIGQRDVLLLALRELAFGPRLDGFAECPECCERLEFTVNVADLRTADSAEPTEAELTLAVEGFDVRFRLPDSLDLAAVAHCDDVGVARDLLVKRCMLHARQGEVEIAVGAVPETVITALAAHVVERDPLSEVQLDLHCPECGHGWPMLLDIVSFFWAEISAQAKRLLHDVHTVARAYGWREADILCMSARRRQLYLEMVT
jgi:hypothetical protein